jgi:tripartite-type tricarboxylate transporter receptor subunit TctC
MNLRRRQFLQFGAAAIAAAASSHVAWAQTYPTRPVRIIAGWPAGGVTDIVARLMGRRLHAPPGHSGERDQRHVLRQAQL